MAGGAVVDREGLRRVFARYASTTIGTYEISEVLDYVTEEITTVLQVDGAGMVLASGERLEFVAASSEAFCVAECAHVQCGEGPCHDADTSGAPVFVDDVQTPQAEGRWPAFVAAARKGGIRAVASMPLRADDQRVGVLNLYHSAPRAWTDEEQSTAHLLADMCAGYIVNTRTLAKSQTLADQLQEALDSRVLIEQAKGVIAERHQISVQAAFDYLREQARAQSRKLHQVASEVVSVPEA